MKQKRGMEIHIRRPAEKRALKNAISRWKLAAVAAYSLLILIPLWKQSQSLLDTNQQLLMVHRFIDVGHDTNAISVRTSERVKPTMPLIGGSGSGSGRGSTSGILSLSEVKKQIVEHNYLSCDDIKNLVIVRQISSGMNKVVFEVKLPGSGVSAIAKRSFKSEPYKQALFKKETKFLKELQERYGTTETLGYFGECQASSDTIFLKRLKKGGNVSDLMRDFSIGYTSVVEMGTPLLLNDQLSGPSSDQICTRASRKCFANFFTESDVEDLTRIARQYANFSKYPLTLREKEMSDNGKAEQYVATPTGLRHADLEMVHLRRNLTYREALEVNCSVLRLLLNNHTLNCTTTATQIEARRERNHRINVTAAVNYCSCSALP